eukprot:10772333-Alexandrium_andersonii.AAC.1
MTTLRSSTSAAARTPMPSIQRRLMPMRCLCSSHVIGGPLRPRGPPCAAHSPGPGRRSCGTPGRRECA